MSLRNYVITDLGPQLADGTGLFVWTTHEDGNFYYAVTAADGALIGYHRADHGTGQLTAGGPGLAVGGRLEPGLYPVHGLRHLQPDLRCAAPG